MNDFTICCRNCGWHWKESESKAADMYICHKCGFDNKFRNQKDNFRNVVQQINQFELDFSQEDMGGDGFIYATPPSSSVIAYKFSDYYTARNYSIMSCDELKSYSVELSKMNPEASGMAGSYATQFIRDFNALRNTVDLMIQNKCPDTSRILPISSCGVGAWSIYPALPYGLSINATTGVISGSTTNVYSGNFTITFTPIFGNPISTNWTLNILNKTQCPSGYTYDGTKKLCVKVETVPAINTLTAVNLLSGQNLTRTPYEAYGWKGTLVHSSSILNSPSTLLDINNKFWIRQPYIGNWSSLTEYERQDFDLNNGAVNRLAVWGIGQDGLIINNYNLSTFNITEIPPINTWIGFSVPIDIPISKTYYVAIAADNKWRISLDGVIVLQDTTGSMDCFQYLHIYPITFNAGKHILKVEGWNDGAKAGFGCEIMDLSGVGNPITFLNAQKDYTNLDPLIIFTTRNKTSFTSNLSCPIGYELNSNLGVCQKILTVSAT